MHDICSVTATCSIFELIGAAFALIAIVGVWWTAYKGLTYSLFAAATWLLVFVSGGRILHTAFELWHLDVLYGKDLFYLIEISFYIVGFFFFTWLFVESLVVFDPRDKRRGQRRKEKLLTLE